MINKSKHLNDTQLEYWKNDDSVVVLTPTGIAASNLPCKAMTFHNFNLINSDLNADNEVILSNLCKGKKKQQLEKVYKPLQLIVLDEISMFTAKIYSLLDSICRMFKNKSNLPFGGITILHIGDVLQLPPVNGTFFFRSKSFVRISREVCIFNRSDTIGFRFKGSNASKWSKILEEVRLGTISDKNLDLLWTRMRRSVKVCYEEVKERYKSKSIDSLSIMTCSPRNNECEMLREKLTSYISNSSGRFHFKARVEVYNSKKVYVGTNIPTYYRHNSLSVDIELFVGCPVVWLANNKYLLSHGVANGSKGVVTQINSDKVTVLWKNSVILEHTQESIHIDQRCTFTQLSFANALSMTIHKMQGLSVDESMFVKVDRIFEGGQFYVALSRATKMDNLYLITSFISPHQLRTIIWADKEALSFEQWCKQNERMINPLIAPTRSVPSLLNEHLPMYSRWDDDVRKDQCGMNNGRLKYKVYGNKDVEKSFLRRKLILIDLETYDNGKTLIPYFAHMKIISGGSTKTTFKDLSFCSMCNVGTSVHIPSTDIMKHVVNIVMSTVLNNQKQLTSCVRRSQNLRKWLKSPYYLCAYNGSGFDFQFFLKELISSFYKYMDGTRFIVRPLLKSSKIVSCSVYDMLSKSICLNFHDLYLLLPGLSLDRACRQFVPVQEHKAKGCFPHLWMNRHHDDFERLCGHNSAFDYDKSSIKYCPDLTLNDFPGEHLVQACKRFFPHVDPDYIDLDTTVDIFDLHRELHIYGPNDVDVLFSLYKAMDQQCLDMLQCSVLRFATMAQFTWYGACISMPKRLTVISDDNRNQRKRRAKHVQHLEIYRFTIEEDHMVSSMITGGKTIPRCKKWTSKDYKSGCSHSDVHDYYVYCDIVSMYPWAMINCILPVGEYRFVLDNSNGLLSNKKTAWMDVYRKVPCILPGSSNHDNFPLELLEVTITLNNHDFEPPVPKHKDYNNTHLGLEWSVGKKHRRWITSVDLWLVLSDIENGGNGGTLHDIHGYVEWFCKDLGKERRSVDRPYSDWVRDCFKRKRDAQVSGDTAKRSINKLAANATYGVTLKRDFFDQVMVIDDMNVLSQFHHNFEEYSTLNIDQILAARANGEHDPAYILSGQRKYYASLERTSRPRYHGAFILSWTRVLLNSMLRVANPHSISSVVNPQDCTKQVLYGDTDSFMFHSSQITPMKRFFGEECGQLTDELRSDSEEDLWKSGIFNKVVDFRSQCPKWYGFKYITPKSIHKSVVKMASIASKSAIIRFPQDSGKDDVKGVDIDTFFDICDNYTSSSNSSERVTAIMDGRLKKVGINRNSVQIDEESSPFDIQGASITRTVFKDKWEGRSEITSSDEGKTLWTVPQGHVMEPRDVAMKRQKKESDNEARRVTLEKERRLRHLLELKNTAETQKKVELMMKDWPFEQRETCILSLLDEIDKQKFLSLRGSAVGESKYSSIPKAAKRSRK